MHIKSQCKTILTHAQVNIRSQKLCQKDTDEKVKNPTCRQILAPGKWCVFCKKRRRTHMCLIRRNNLPAEIPACQSSAKIKQNKRIPRKRDFYSTYESEVAVDSALNSPEKL